LDKTYYYTWSRNFCFLEFVYVLSFFFQVCLRALEMMRTICRGVKLIIIDLHAMN